MKPYYSHAGITIYHGDCREVLPRVEGDLVVTDPPYNAGKNYGDATDDRRECPEWTAWMDEVLAIALTAGKDGILSFLSQTAYRQYVRLGKYEMAWTAVWVKPLSMAICAAPFMPHWEPIAYWGPKRRKNGDGSGWGSDVIEANVEFGKPRYDHPTPKPYSAMKQLIERTDANVIIDPFCGSGTTLKAAKDVNRSAIGIEIEEKYCEIAAKRLSQEVFDFSGSGR